MGFRSTLWVVVMSGQCVLGSLTHFGWFAKCPKCGGTPVTIACQLPESAIPDPATPRQSDHSRPGGQLPTGEFTTRERRAWVIVRIL